MARRTRPQVRRTRAAPRTQRARSGFAAWCAQQLRRPGKLLLKVAIVALGVFLPSPTVTVRVCWSADCVLAQREPPAGGGLRLPAEGGGARASDVTTTKGCPAGAAP